MPLTYTAKQREGLRILKDTAKSRIVFDGGGRSGKTELMFDRIFWRAAHYPGSWHVILRKARAHCTSALWNGTMMKYLAKHVDPQHSWIYKLNKDEMTCTLINGSKIMFDGCDDEQRVRRIFGNEYCTMWFNEASEFTWDVVENLFSRAVQRADVDPRTPDGTLPATCPVQVWFDTNPKGRRHWLYKVGVQHIHPETGEPLRDAERWARLGGWSPYDNREHLSEDAIATYEAMNGLTRERMLKGVWCEAEGAVYSEFRDDVHVCTRCKGSERPQRCPRVWSGDGNFRMRYVVRGIDFGYNDPFVCLWGALDEDMRLLFYKLHYQRKRIVSDHAGVIKNRNGKDPVIWTVADHDAEDAATLRREGVPTRPAKKDRPIKAGCDRVMKRLLVEEDGRPRLEVCKYLNPMLDEFGSYVWNARKDSPKDLDNHVMDAMRYICAEIDSGRGSEILPAG